MCSVGYATMGVGILATTALPPNPQTSQFTESLTSLQSLQAETVAIPTPQIKEPQWLVDKKAAEAAAARTTRPAVRSVTYDVTTRGAVSADLSEFRAQANATLNDGRGWARMGVSFTEVATGGMFTLVLSEASQLPTFSSGCSAEYSCRAGRYVIINQDRWLGATPSWNAGGGSLRDYRHMVVNHETGHWLGHGHQACGGAGQPAPVMQQQSISLQGCSFNPWPLATELWSTQLGIGR